MIRPQRYSHWVDPAPLEVQRPRPPWWTLLPRTPLLAASPPILLAILATVVTFLARRMWRYPLFLISTAVALGLGVSRPWGTPVTLLTTLAALSGL